MGAPHEPEQLYSIANVIALVAMVLGVYNSVHHWRDRPTVERVVMNWLLAVTFLMKAPYLADKLLAMIALATLVGGYILMAILDTVRRARSKGPGRG